jgi:hypothetical protein
MPDGIPVAWPEEGEGAELDECNGFVNERLGFYHYVATTGFPYTAGCLRGCVRSDFNGNMQIAGRSSDCDPSDVQYDYSSLHDGLLTFDASPVDSAVCASTYPLTF